MSDIQSYYWKHSTRAQVLAAVQGVLLIANSGGSGWLDASSLLEAAFSDPDWVEITATEAAQLAKSYGVPWPPPLPT